MFFARVRSDDGRLNGIELQGLKNKLGTRQLPTGELLLDGMDAFRVISLMFLRILNYFKYISLEIEIN
jgi:hypothetical protein